jgi:hypothetical protein
VQAVAAEQDTVAVLQLFDEEVGADIGLCAQATGNDVAVRMGSRLLFGEQTGANLLRDPGMIEGDLSHVVVAHEIATTVADIEEIGAAAMHDQRDTGSAHARHLRVLARELKDCLIGLFDGVR